MSVGHLVILRYLTREILLASLGIVVLLVLILMSAQVIKLLERAVAGDISLEMVFVLAGTQVPVLLELVIPLAATLAALLTFGRLKEDSELAVLHAGGFSNTHLFALAGIPSLGIAMLVALLSLVLTPASNLYKEEQKQVERELTVFDTIQPGRFQTDREGRLLFARALADDRAALMNVFIADTQTHRSNEFRYIFADRATQEIRDEDKFLVLFDGAQYRGKVDDDTWEVTDFERYLIRIDPPTSLRPDPLSGQSTQTLINANDSASQAELAWRVSVPLVGLVMLPLVFLIARGSHRMSRFVWIIPIILIQFAYVSALMSARHPGNDGFVWMQFIGIHSAFLGLSAILLAITAIGSLKPKVMA